MEPVDANSGFTQALRLPHTPAPLPHPTHHHAPHRHFYTQSDYYAVLPRVHDATFGFHFTDGRAGCDKTVSAQADAEQPQHRCSTRTAFPNHRALPCLYSFRPAFGGGAVPGAAGVLTDGTIARPPHGAGYLPATPPPSAHYPHPPSCHPPTSRSTPLTPFSPHKRQHYSGFLIPVGTVGRRHTAARRLRHC